MHTKGQTMLLTLLPRMHAYVTALSRDESGQGLAEYSLILLLIAVVAIVTLTALGGTVSSLISVIGTRI